MKTPWDYTELARPYLKRPDYAVDAIEQMLFFAGLNPGDPVCDVGAGVAHLTLMLAVKELQVTAVEPNDAMRALGIERTRHFTNVQWFEGTGEASGQPDHAFKLVTFGSSFNVTDREQALLESKRILQDKGTFAAMWNHRDLNDPLQQEIEKLIQSMIPDYGYGTRREDQTDFLRHSGLFSQIETIEGQIDHVQMKADVIEAWESHATLHRQAGDNFSAIIEGIRQLLDNHPTDIHIPYTTRIWVARLK